MILKGDCISVIKAMKPNSVDAIVTDPPYGLEFMNKSWDKLQKSVIKEGCQWWEGEFKGTGFKKLPQPTGSRNFKCKKCGHYKHSGTPCKCDSPDWEDSTIKKQHEMQLWHTQWLTQAYRVLKPGGSMLVMGGTRTFHRLMCAIEDSGFIIKDTLMWLYGSGFPKAQDLGKMIDKRMGKEREIISVKKHSINFDNAKANKTGYLADPANRNNEKCFGYGEETITIPSTDLAKHWDGFKVGGIKPAYEPIIWAVKPPEGSYIDNVLKWGVGAVNVDETRISHNEQIKVKKKQLDSSLKNPKCIQAGRYKDTTELKSSGRFPSNIILSHHPECVQVGVKRVKTNNQQTEGREMEGQIFGKRRDGKHYGNPDGYEEVESWRCHPDCPIFLLDEQAGNRPGMSGGGAKDKKKKPEWVIQPFNRQLVKQEWLRGDNGGPSRFFYCAKASRSERNAGLERMEEKELGHNRFDKCAKCGRYIFQNPDRNSACKCEQPQREHNKIRGNSHPTCKPIKLFEWLIKLVTRKGQIVLDPFLGSGTTAISAHNTGRKCIGIEREEEYLEIAKRRVDYWKGQPKQMEMGI